MQAKPYSPGARALARRVYRLTGYPLLSFGTIQAAARGDADPAPLEPRTLPLAMREMRAMVLSLEPILKGMNATHQKGIKVGGSVGRRSVGGRSVGRGVDQGRGCPDALTQFPTIYTHNHTRPSTGVRGAHGSARGAAEGQRGLLPLHGPGLQPRDLPGQLPGALHARA